MIEIIAIDKIKEKYITEGIDNYLIRLNKKLKITIKEVTPAKYHQIDSIETALKYEADKILAALPKSIIAPPVKAGGGRGGATLSKDSTRIALSKQVPASTIIIALDKSGTQYTSPDFSKLIYGTLNHSHISFIIGGAYGLSSEILAKSTKVISFSKMTFTHEMFRLILIEQIYRAFTIENNIKYHN